VKAVGRGAFGWTAGEDGAATRPRLADDGPELAAPPSEFGVRADRARVVSCGPVSAQIQIRPLLDAAALHLSSYFVVF
jgi:hypothetical protein